MDPAAHVNSALPETGVNTSISGTGSLFVTGNLTAMLDM